MMLTHLDNLFVKSCLKNVEISMPFGIYNFVENTNYFVKITNSWE
jgi:hypothetical protein